MKLVTFKGTLYKLKKHKKIGLNIYKICVNKCHIESGSKACNNVFMDHCGDRGYFVKLKEAKVHHVKRLKGQHG